MKSTTLILGAILATSSVYAHKDLNLKTEFTHPSLLQVTPNAPIQDGNVSASVDNKYPAGARFTIPMNGKSVEIEVEKSSLLASDYTETLLDIDDEGKVINRAAAISSDPTDCYYRGRVVGSTGSVVALDVCDGHLQGLITHQGRSYSLEDPDQHTRSWWQTIKSKATSLLSPAPVMGPETDAFAAAMARGVAVVDADDELTQVGGIELHGDDIAIPAGAHSATGLSMHSAAAADEPSDAPTDSDAGGGLGLGSRPVRYVEMIVFSDNNRYKSLGSNTGKSTLQIMNNVAAYYLAAPLRHEVRVVLKGQYMFNHQDPYYAQLLQDGTTQVMGTYGLLNVFLQYVAQNRASFPNYDASLLLSARAFQSNIRGLANVGSVCSPPTLSGGINMVTYRSTVLNSVLTAHESGHILGASHDGQSGALDCPGHSHVMGPYVGENTGFSVCSQRAFNAFLENQWCLMNNPTAAARGQEEADPWADFKSDFDYNAGRPAPPPPAAPDSAPAPVYSEDDFTVMLLAGAFILIVAVAGTAALVSRAAKRKANEQVAAAQTQQRAAELVSPTYPGYPAAPHYAMQSPAPTPTHVFYAHGPAPSPGMATPFNFQQPSQ